MKTRLQSASFPRPQWNTTRVTIRQQGNVNILIVSSPTIPRAASLAFNIEYLSQQLSRAGTEIYCTTVFLYQFFAALRRRRSRRVLFRAAALSSAAPPPSSRRDTPRCAGRVFFRRAARPPGHARRRQPASPHTGFRNRDSPARQSHFNKIFLRE